MSNGKQEIEPVLDGARTVEDFRAEFLAAFGGVDETVARALYEQLLNGLHADPRQPLDNSTANLALALLHEVRPREVLEAMLGCQLVIAHVAAMETSRRAFHVDQTPGGRAAYLALSRRLMTIFVAQLDALNRHRGKGTTQKIVIERVLVAPGAQAVVGAVASGGRGDGR